MSVPAYQETVSGQYRSEKELNTRRELFKEYPSKSFNRSAKREAGFNPILLSDSLPFSKRTNTHLRTKVRKKPGSKIFNFPGDNKFSLKSVVKKNHDKTSSRDYSYKNPGQNNKGFETSFDTKREKISQRRDFSKFLNLAESLPLNKFLKPEIISFVIAFFIFSLLCAFHVPSMIGNRDASLKRMISVVSESELKNFAVEEEGTVEDVSSPKLASFSLDIPSEESAEEGLRIKHYKVRKGETLSLIAKMYDVSCESIASLNGINDIRKVKPGEELGIPSEDGLLYKIERNDTHTSIAEKLKLDGDSRTKLLSDYPKLLQAGTEIFVRGAQMNPHRKGKLTEDYFLYPINGTVLTRFGETVNKRTGVESFSEGIELAAPKGSEAFASRGGTVIYSRQHPSLGGCVMIEHKGGTVSVYGQLLERSVVVGETVEQGAPVGKIGAPVFGKSPHLFFSIKKNGTPVDPLEYLY